MVPQRFWIADGGLPLSPNGKIDSLATHEMINQGLLRPARGVDDLPEPSDDNEDGFSATVIQIARVIRSVWSDVLGIGEFSSDSEFSALGGGSLDGIQVIGRLQALGYHITAKQFFAKPTVRHLAGVISRTDVGAKDTATPDHSGQSRQPLSSAQAWFFRQHFEQPNHWNQAILLDCHTNVDPVILEASVNKLIRLHPLLRGAFARSGDEWCVVSAEMCRHRS